MTRKFGFELEFPKIEEDTLLKSALIESVTEHDQESKVIINRETFRFWTFKGDSHTGYEITSPALISNAENLAKVYNVIDGIRHRTIGHNISRKNYGFHVHLDISEFNQTQIRNLIKIFYEFEPNLIRLQPPSRNNNPYCVPLRSSDPEWINRFDPETTPYNQCGYIFDHFTALNFNKFNSKGTIEIRYASSTSRGKKVTNWINLLLILTEISKNLNQSPLNTHNNIQEFINQYSTNLDWLESSKERVLNWITERTTELSTRQTIESPPPAVRRRRERTTV